MRTRLQTVDPAGFSTHIKWVFLFCVALVLSACSPSLAATPTRTPPPTVILSTRELAATRTPVPPATPAPTAKAAPIQVYFDRAIPSDARDAVVATLKPPTGASLVFTDEAAAADVVFMMTAPTVPSTVIAEWVYAVAMPFPTLTDTVTHALITEFWDGHPDAMAVRTDNGAVPTLFVTPDTLRSLTAFFGHAPAPNAPIQIRPQDQLADAMFAARPASWAIVPFDQLDPKLKVLALDGVSPLHRNGDNNYWLKFRVGMIKVKRGVEWVAPYLQNEPLTNRDESRMTLLAMTGTTALGRDIAWVMEQKGVLYPGQKIKSWLTTADIVHLSNEVSFNPDCPPPRFGTGETIFCSAPKYLDLFKDVRARVIENTGNHINDYGWQAFSYTLSLYDQAGMVYFGGGRTLTEAQRAITVTDHGNVLGFVGCNPVGPPIAWVNGLNDGRPGSAACQSPYPVMQAELKKLKASGAVPIATLQYQEQPLGDFSYNTAPSQVADFRHLVDAGAAIVSGSQGHQSQGFDLYRGGFIHFAVGNLFFDQTQTLGLRQTFVDRYVIYKGRVLSVELLTGIRDVDNWAQPRPMTQVERRAFLQTIFSASGW